MADSSPSPAIIRPIPRRPFATDPAASPDISARPQQQRQQLPNPIRFLEPQAQQYPTEPLSATSTTFSDADQSTSISRSQSIRNLTSSTLFGIFSPTVASRGSFVGGDSGLSEPGTPWGAGAGTPGSELLADDDHGGRSNEALDSRTSATAADLEQVREASQSLMMLQHRRRRGESIGLNGVSGISSIKLSGLGQQESTNGAVSAPAPKSSSPPKTRPQSGVFTCVRIAYRACLLFALGMGYGVMVARLRSDSSLIGFDDVLSSMPAESATSHTSRYDALNDWRYLTSWGISGVVLGTLLPWLDGVWHSFGAGGNLLGSKGHVVTDTDWALVVRGIGAFAGVVFAMRKLPWASTMQASLTLALADPFLWYLLDRSKSGLFLSAAVGFLGSVVLVSLGLDLMPNPGLRHGPYYGVSGSDGCLGGGAYDMNKFSDGDASASLVKSCGGLPALSAVTAETAVWMLSVLFCSCICFGSIGRRLALSPVATLPASEVAR